MQRPQDAIITHHTFKEWVQIIIHDSGKSSLTGALRAYWSEYKWGQDFWKGNDIWHQQPLPKGGTDRHTKICIAVLFNDGQIQI